ncbi:MAG TPA: D-2-hydroxyacid dehydrogenase family protein [Burkholderiales bacterium]|nr:D-2-hydroxyacid dehydrogenase family protein [Burkholderiales bacterium]
MNVTILDDYADAVRTFECFRKLEDHSVRVSTECVRDPDALAALLEDTEALVLLRERTRVTRALVERLPRLKMITLNGPWPHIDVAACTERGIIVCSEHRHTSYATAELTWGLVIAAMRHIPQQMAELKRGGWQTRIGTGLRGRTLGVYGYGRIGKQVAGYGKAFGMRVLVWSREKAREDARRDGYDVPPAREALFDEADVLSLHVRLVPETRGMVSAADLARMKPTAVLVNTSRAELIESGALEAALRAGRPGSAAVDVYEDEPVLGAKHPLLALDNVVCTPHLGYVERDQLERYFSDQFERVLAYARGAPYGVVNPKALAGCRPVPG